MRSHTLLVDPAGFGILSMWSLHCQTSGEVLANPPVNTAELPANLLVNHWAIIQMKKSIP